MNLIREADFRKEIKASPQAGYLFFGDEDYLKAFSIRHAREVLCPDPTFALFNEMRLDAVDFTPDKLLDALMPLPMMADRKLVTLTGLNFNTMRPHELDALCDALSTLPSYDYNVLILSVAADCFDSGILPKRPSQIYQRLSEYLTPVHFERCTASKLCAWIGKHFAHNGVEVSPALCAAMIEYCGHSMFVLANEIDKLSYYVLSHGKAVANEDEMHLVCTPVSEYDTFAFTNAIMEGQHELALNILADYRRRRVDPIIILSDATRVICDMLAIRAMSADGSSNAEIASVMKMHEYKVGLYQKSLRNSSERRLRRALEACISADNSLKLAQTGGTAQGYAPLERLICSL